MIRMQFLSQSNRQMIPNKYVLTKSRWDVTTVHDNNFLDRKLKQHFGAVTTKFIIIKNKINKSW